MRNQLIVAACWATAMISPSAILAQTTVPATLVTPPQPPGQLPAPVMSVDSPVYWLTRAAADASQIADPAERTGVLTSIASQYAALGDTSDAAAAGALASDSAAKISDAQQRFNAYLSLASFHDLFGDGKASTALFAAGTAAAALDPSPARDEANQAIARELGITQGFDVAARSANKIPDLAQRSAALADLAATFAQSSVRHRENDYVAAMAAATAAANSIADPDARQNAQVTLVRTAVQAGDLTGAKAIAATLSYPAAEGEANAYLANAFARAGRNSDAEAAISQMLMAAGGSPDDRRAAIWLDISRARLRLGDKPGAIKAINTALESAVRLEPADRTDALAAASGLKAEAGDVVGAALSARDAARAAKDVVDPVDISEVQMSVAAAMARSGMGQAARDAVAAARDAATKIPANKRHAAGDPPAETYLTAVQAAAAAGDFATAKQIAADVNDPGLNHDAALAIAGAEVNMSQYQAAEDVAAKEGSLDSEAAVCGMIASSLARTRNATDALAWVARLPIASDRIAASLAIAQYEESRPLPPAPAAGAER